MRGWGCLSSPQASRSGVFFWLFGFSGSFIVALGQGRGTESLDPPRANTSKLLVLSVSVQFRPVGLLWMHFRAQSGRVLLLGYSRLHSRMAAREGPSRALKHGAHEDKGFGSMSR
jgi:hypothetical protein